MASVTDKDTNIVVTRDYSDIYSVKETAISNLGPKYFPDVDLSGLNVGALGFILEQIGNITEDGFNTASVLINEAFPNKAVIPESIYSHASIFQLDNTFASCCKCVFILLLDQREIINYGAKNNITKKTVFYIDKDTVITVEDIPFTLDYDIKIEAQEKQVSGAESEWNFTAQYSIDTTNSISEVNDPYLKIRKTGDGRLLLTFTAHQVERTVIEDTIISNTKINYPVLEYTFENHLCGFDIFYKSPKDKVYTQLEKKIKFSIPTKTNFCYYRLKDTNTLEITFSSKDGYFQPEFNSYIKIVLYTTLGKDGKFESYNGSNITFTMNPEVYSYNSSMTIAAKTISDSSGGTESMSLESLQALTVEGYSTANELSTENDIMTYFYNYKYRYGNEILVIKRRDDVTERLFSAFLLMKRDDYIYPTNTLYLNINEDDFDISSDGNKFTLKPGHTFIYKNGSNDTLEIAPKMKKIVYDDVEQDDGSIIQVSREIVVNPMSYNADEVEYVENYAKETYGNSFVYTNPFLISVTKSPNLVGMYKNVVNQSATLDYIYSNDIAFTQFITSKISVTRNLGEIGSYTLQLSLIPSSSLDQNENEPSPYIANLNTYEGNSVRIILGLVASNNEEIGYVEMLPTKIDENDNSNVTFTAELITDDSITSTKQFSITNAVSLKGSDYVLIPISDASVNVYILYDMAYGNNKFLNCFNDMENFIITNMYSTTTDKITFIEPLNLMRSTVVYSNTGTDSEPVITANLSLLPMVKASVINDTENFNAFVSKLTSNYEYLESCLPQLRNNTHIDVKFYNTYGKSNNYYIGDNQEFIDRVNIEIKFKISLVSGTDETEVKSNLQTFIKEFIETVNDNGNNDLYISNLIRSIETNFSSVHHLKFMGINSYNTDYQTISVRTTDIEELKKEERRRYVPEILVIDKNNVQISIDVTSGS